MEDAEGNEQVEHLLHSRKGSVMSFGEKIYIRSRNELENEKVIYFTHEFTHVKYFTLKKIHVY